MQPKRQKHRKQFRGRRRGNATRGIDVSFGEFGLKCLGPGWISAKQIEAGRRAIAHTTSRGGKVWVRVFPDKPITKKPLEVRQGSGKGNVEYWVAPVQPGRIMFEIEGVPEDLAREALGLAAAKLPVRTIFVARTIM